MDRHRPILVAGVKASLVAGIPSGIAARIAMAALAAAGGTSMMSAVGQLTLEGTLRIVVVPMLLGIPFAWALLAVGARWRHQSLAVRALAYGIAGIVMPGLLFLTDSEFGTPGPNSTIGRWLFIPSFFLFGAIAGLVGDRLLGRIQASDLRRAS